eukprot:m.237238 g.237238  ORF g.237238 m.237238 type:complete len:126 (+) comp19366_c0_seq2:308-685(+)
MDHVLKTVEEQERLAEEILAEKHQVVAYDQRRNENRVALREVRQKTLAKKSKVWMNLGDFFVHMPREQVISLIEEDQEKLSNEIERVRNDMQKKTQKLRRKEGKAMSEGWNLKGMAEKEISGPAL